MKKNSSTASRSNLATLGAALISQSKTTDASTATRSAPAATATALADAEVRAVHVVPSAEEDSMLTDLEIAFRKGGIPAGTNGINRSSLLRFALRYLHTSGVTIDQVKDMEKFCVKLRQERLDARATRRGTK
jgi:hypothetical protein